MGMTIAVLVFPLQCFLCFLFRKAHSQVSGNDLHSFTRSFIFYRLDCFYPGWGPGRGRGEGRVHPGQVA